MTDEIDEPTGAAEPDGAPEPTGFPEPPGKPRLTKAQRLEARAARLREADEQRAARVMQAAASGRPAPAPRRLVLATALLGAVCAALVALLVVLFIAWQDRGDSISRLRKNAQQQAALRASALHAAQSFALDFGAYDYQHLDTEFAEVATRMTPDFAKNYLEQSDRLKPAFIQYKTHVTAQLQGSGITSVTPSNAVVVVFLDQTVTTSQSSTPRIDRNRLVIHLVRSKDGKWLVQKLDAK